MSTGNPCKGPTRLGLQVLYISESQPPGHGVFFVSEHSLSEVRECWLPTETLRPITYQFVPIVAERCEPSCRTSL